MSLVTMNRESFYSLGDEKLGSACMEPTFMQIRGKSPAVKAEVISQLTRGQQALCMFRVMYGHSYKSAAEYYLMDLLHAEYTGVLGPDDGGGAVF